MCFIAVHNQRSFPLSEPLDFHEKCSIDLRDLYRYFIFSFFYYRDKTTITRLCNTFSFLLIKSLVDCIIGVIFRLQWSRDKSKIASVSDDRTVRVWNVSESNKGYQVCSFLGRDFLIIELHFVEANQSDI